MLVKMVEVLVKIAVMMMAPGGVPAPPEARGESPPSSSSSLTFSLDGRRVSPLVLGLHGVGGARAPPRLDLSLCLSLFLRSGYALSPFRIYMEIRNSDWTETFAVNFLPKISFLAAKEGHQPPYGWPTRVRGAPGGTGAPPASWVPWCSTDLNSNSIYSRSGRKKSERRIHRVLRYGAAAKP